MNDSEFNKDPNIGSGDANDMQRAIRARALHTVQRRPAKFWYTSPLRLVTAVVMAAVLVVTIGFAVEKCLQAFHLLVEIYASQPKHSAPPPDSEQPAVIYIQPDVAITPEVNPEPPPASPTPSKK
jgi:hypothetical protein